MTFSPADLSQSQIINIPEVFKDFPACRSNLQEQPAIIQQAVSQQQAAISQQAVFQPQPAIIQQLTAAINSSNQQQQPTAAINSSSHQQQSTAAINNHNQQQQPVFVLPAALTRSTPASVSSHYGS